MDLVSASICPGFLPCAAGTDLKGQPHVLSTRPGGRGLRDFAKINRYTQLQEKLILLLVIPDTPALA